MPCCGDSKGWIAEANWLKGAVGLAKSALGIDRATDAEIKRRLDQCRQCPQATRSGKPKFAKHQGLTNLSRCRLCKCFVAAKAKISSERCPLDKIGHLLPH